MYRLMTKGVFQLKRTVQTQMVCEFIRSDQYFNFFIYRFLRIHIQLEQTVRTQIRLHKVQSDSSPHCFHLLQGHFLWYGSRLVKARPTMIFLLESATVSEALMTTSFSKVVNKFDK